MANELYGVGNPLVDLLVRVDDSFLENFGLEKGRFHLLDEEKAERIVKDLDYEARAGGSVANTLSVFSGLGGKSTLAGRIGKDSLGKSFRKDLPPVGDSLITSNEPTGRAICLITPDSERTFAVYLGAATSLEKEDLDEERISSSKYLHLSGYQIDSFPETVREAIRIAKNASVKLSLDIADPGVVERNKGIFDDVLKDMDVLFLNDKEAKALTGKGPESSLIELSELVDLVFVKIGEKGSLYMENGKMIEVEPYKADAVDSTGAGDAYAGVVLYGLVKNLPLEKVTDHASYLASKVVEQVGARIDPGSITYRS
ncbi:MAG: adenosine kinase [Nanobdellota archaeon]